VVNQVVGRGRTAMRILASLIGIGALCFVLRAPILVALGGMMVRADPLSKADAIIVLAGGTPQREIEGADLYLAGYAPRVVLTVERDSPAEELLHKRGIPYEDQNELKRRILVALGVPDSAVIQLKETRATSTRMESDIVREWALENHARRIIVVTSAFHTARASFVFRRALRHDSVEVLMRPASEEAFDPSRWWTDRVQLRVGVFELQKLLFYQIAYRWD